ncbi:MAG: thrombospondin type 3 repeat-containing protein [Dehalococcoidia bacterium]
MLPSDPDVVAIAAAGNHSLALLADGTVLAWGSDDFGELGDDATFADQTTPVAVSGFALPSDPDVLAIAAGFYHSLALLADGTLRAWGYDGNGELGDGGTNTSMGTPVPVSGFAVPADPDVVAIAAGDSHSLALPADGTLRAWGNDGDGQLGDGGTNTNQPTPVPVGGFALASDPDVLAIAAGGTHSLALLADGTMRAWGNDESGQLGDGGSNSDQPTPVAVSGFAVPADPDVAAIGAGGFHSLAVGGTPVVDSDADGVPNDSDNCPIKANAGQEDSVHPGTPGDACDDPDFDGYFDSTDNCPDLANADQLNTDGADDGGNACDGDDDNDTVLDETDNCPLAANTNQADADGDGAGTSATASTAGRPATASRRRSSTTRARSPAQPATTSWSATAASTSSMAAMATTRSVPARATTR